MFFLSPLGGGVGVVEVHQYYICTFQVFNKKNKNNSSHGSNSSSSDKPLRGREEEKRNNKAGSPHACFFKDKKK